MKNPICTLLMVLGVSAAAPLANAAGGSGGEMITGDAASGEQIVVACAACHGEGGNSTAPNFPNLAGLGEKYILKQLHDVKEGKREIVEMTGQLDGMSDQNLADIAAYYNAQSMQLTGSSDAQVQVNSGAKVDSLSLGEKIYRAGNAATNVPACTGCHSPRGLGNGPAAYPRLGGQHAQYIEKQLHDFRAGNRTNGGDAMIMRNVAEHLSDAEISALANYIAGLN